VGVSNEAQVAFNAYFSQFDPDESEWLDRSTEQIFIDGFTAGAADYAALKEENERLKNAVAQYGELFKASAAERDALKARVAELEEILADYKEERW
jgi:predicted nuclease with TOPRIM domain